LCSQEETFTAFLDDMDCRAARGDCVPAPGRKEITEIPAADPGAAPLLRPDRENARKSTVVTQINEISGPPR
jgi:hypothetical protein